MVHMASYHEPCMRLVILLEGLDNSVNLLLTLGIHRVWGVDHYHSLHLNVVMIMNIIPNSLLLFSYCYQYCCDCSRNSVTAFCAVPLGAAAEEFTLWPAC